MWCCSSVLQFCWCSGSYIYALVVSCTRRGWYLRAYWTTATMITTMVVAMARTVVVVVLLQNSINANERRWGFYLIVYSIALWIRIHNISLRMCIGSILPTRLSLLWNAIYNILRANNIQRSHDFRWAWGWSWSMCCLLVFSQFFF